MPQHWQNKQCLRLVSTMAPVSFDRIYGVCPSPQVLHLRYSCSVLPSPALSACCQFECGMPIEGNWVQSVRALLIKAFGAESFNLLSQIKHSPSCTHSNLSARRQACRVTPQVQHLIALLSAASILLFLLHIAATTHESITQIYQSLRDRLSQVETACPACVAAKFAATHANLLKPCGWLGYCHHNPVAPVAQRPSHQHTNGPYGYISRRWQLWKLEMHCHHSHSLPSRPTAITQTHQYTICGYIARRWQLWKLELHNTATASTEAMSLRGVTSTKWVSMQSPATPNASPPSQPDAAPQCYDDSNSLLGSPVAISGLGGKSLAEQDPVSELIKSN